MKVPRPRALFVVDKMQNLLQVFARFALRVLIVRAQQVRGLACSVPGPNTLFARPSGKRQRRQSPRSSIILRSVSPAGAIDGSETGGTAAATAAALRR